MIRPLFSWLAGRHRTGEPSTTAPADPAGEKSSESSGIEAGRREVQALEALRHVRFESREEAALHTQLARAPRDIGALFGLLQFHVRRGNAQQAESFAHALWDETDAQGGLWLRAAALCRSIDPDNPLYSDDPFTALAQHAAAQPLVTHAPMPLSALDLSLPVADSPEGLTGALHALGDFGAFGGESAAGQQDIAQPDAGKSVFDYLNAPTSLDQLPASLTGLTLDLDDLPSGDGRDSLDSLESLYAPDAAQAAERTLRLFSGSSASAGTVPSDAVTETSLARMKYTKYRPVRRTRGRKKSRK